MNKLLDKIAIIIYLFVVTPIIILFLPYFIWKWVSKRTDKIVEEKKNKNR